ncbi:MAG: hypothetical protein LBF72_02100 [Holosporales bacterium]|nr:hypothetical protein [Holosporales bacterium]
MLQLITSELWAGDTERSVLMVREHSSSFGFPSKLQTLLWRRSTNPQFSCD